jgi:hypothetical protein
METCTLRCCDNVMMTKMLSFFIDIFYRVKLRVVVTLNSLNVEHRTSNFERQILMALCFIYFETRKSKNIEL